MTKLSLHRLFMAVLAGLPLGTIACGSTGGDAGAPDSPLPADAGAASGDAATDAPAASTPNTGVGTPDSCNGFDGGYRSGGCGGSYCAPLSGDPTAPDGAVDCNSACDFHPYDGGWVTCAVTSDGAAVICSTCMNGRRTAGLSEPARLAVDRSPGAFFAEIAYLEAVSVEAFRRLDRELGGLGAPKSLRRGARRAKRDEVRHTRTTSALARQLGARRLSVTIAPAKARSLLDIAIENSVEGCVRETFGALLAHHQAECAESPLVRTAMRRIAKDETRHAAFSWATHRFLFQRLTRHERTLVVAAMRDAASALMTPSDEIPTELAASVGFPASKEYASLARGLFAQMRPTA